MLAAGCLCSYLVYRIVDTNVTLEYAQSELKRAHLEADVISEFQRLPCSAIDGKVDGVRFYKKDDVYVADGVEFICKHVGTNSYLLRKD